MHHFSTVLALLALAGAGEPEPRNIRQLTTDGTHAEAYFSTDGRKLVLMGLRAGDAADQIYELDLPTGALARVSDGRGKTT